jgi:hypothetical protein
MATSTSNTTDDLYRGEIMKSHRDLAETAFPETDPTASRDLVAHWCRVT